MLPAWPSAACISARRRSRWPCRSPSRVRWAEAARGASVRGSWSSLLLSVEDRVHCRVPRDHWVKPDWRFAALAGMAVASRPGAPVAMAIARPPRALGALPIAAIALAGAAAPDSRRRGAAWPGLLVIALVACLAGLLVGGRAARRDRRGRSTRAPRASASAVDGFVAGVPRRNGSRSTCGWIRPRGGSWWSPRSRWASCRSGPRCAPRASSRRPSRGGPRTCGVRASR